MRVVDILGVAFSTFRNNKMRFLLTILGVSIGIGAIVFLFSIGYGVQKIAIGEIASMKALTTYNVSTGNSSILSLNSELVDKMSKLEHVSSVSENYSVSGQISYGASSTDLMVSAVKPEYVDLESPRMDSGKLFLDNSEKSIVITSSALKAFNVTAESILNQNIKISMYVPKDAEAKNLQLIESEYRVIGVIRDTSAMYAYIPLGTIEFPKESSYAIVKVKVDNSKNMAGVKTILTDMGLKASSVGEKVDEMNNAFNIAKYILIALGAIALFVASIGMFNTLTISLLERTKDIGTMKSLGATDKEIYLLFLTESTIISFVGGAVGVLLSFVMGTGINVVISVLAQKAGAEAVKLVQMPAIFVVFILLFSLIIGLLTGFYPARRAARLNPLDALRYE